MDTQVYGLPNSRTLYFKFHGIWTKKVKLYSVLDPKHGVYTLDSKGGDTPYTVGSEKYAI